VQNIEDCVAVPWRDFVDEAKYARHIFHCLNAGMRIRSNVQQAAPPAQCAEKAFRFFADADLRVALNDALGKNGASDRKVDPLLGLMP
jgi:hypothetical protein